MEKQFKEGDIVFVRFGNLSEWTVAKYVYASQVGTHYVKSFLMKKILLYVLIGNMK
jgi:hypothetical protein